MLIVTNNMQLYFREALSHALKESKIQVTQSAEVYLVHFLNEFSRAEKAFAGTDYGEKINIFSMLERACQAEDHEALQIWRHMGDVSLYLLGYFGEADSARPASRSYYLGMGAKAYNQVSLLFRYQALDSSLLFKELSERFPDLVELVLAISRYQSSQKKD